MTALAELSETGSYRLVDEIPSVAAQRLAVRTGALALLERRRDEGADAAIAELIPVDALSTACHVIAAEQAHGPKSAERTERWNGLVQDCDRLVAEWFRKKKPEYFKPLHHSYDPATLDFFSHGLSIRQMTENALVPIPDKPEEEMRRVNERVEDATPFIVRRYLGSVATRQVIRTVSECTDWAEADYAEDQRLKRSHRGYGGYVPEISKVMFRDIWLDGVTGDRFEEQLGLPGTYITHEIIQEALRRRDLETGHMDKTELHGSQILAGDDLISFMALLDTVASEEWCTNIFAGEEVPHDFVKDYAGFREEAIRRQEGLRGTSETVATFVLDLARDDVDRRAALPMVEDFVKKLLLEIGKKDSTVVEQMFDAQTAKGLQEVTRLEQAGRHDEAYELMQTVEQRAPGGGFCGAGSCGLENINLQSEAGRGLAEKVKARPGDTVLKDTVRACKCGKKGIIYAYNKSKVNKYCTNCEALELK